MRRARIIAWSLSIGFHVALAAFLLREGTGSVRTLPQQAETLTREATDDDSAFTFAVAPISENAPKSIAIAPPTGHRPIEPARPLPTELQKLVRELGTRPPARVEVQDVTPIDYRAPTGSGIAPLPVEKASSGSARPAGKSVVYVLDRSTSMGLTRETFDAARSAVLASVLALPDDTRVQVIAYSGAAVRLLPGQDLPKKSDRFCEDLAAALDSLKPEGESRHDRALRGALSLGAEILVFITDAGEDELAALRPILKGHGKPVSVSVVRVTAGRVAAPQAFR